MGVACERPISAPGGIYSRGDHFQMVAGTAARWSGGIKTATHGDADHPLRIGDIEIPCYVLDDETRVTSIFNG